MQTLSTPLPYPVTDAQKPVWSPDSGGDVASVLGQISASPSSHISSYEERKLVIQVRKASTRYTEAASDKYLREYWNDKHDAGFLSRRRTEQELADYIESVVEEGFAGGYEEELGRKVEAMRSCRRSGDHGIGLFESAEERVRKLPNGKEEAYKPRSVQGIVRYDSKCGQVRLCPDEARAEGRRVGSKYTPAISALAKGRGRHVYYLVFTTPNAPAGGLHDEKRRQFKRWANMVLRWKRDPAAFGQRGNGRFVGALVSQEDPLSASNDWNVHLNVVLVTHGTFDFAALRSQWGANVEIKELTNSNVELSKALVELCKYQVKHISDKAQQGRTAAPGMTDWPKDLWMEWYRANSGFRRTRSYGELFRVEAPEKAEILDSVWVGRFAVRCPKASGGFNKYDAIAEVGVYPWAQPTIDLIQVNKSDTELLSEMLSEGRLPRGEGYFVPGDGGGGVTPRGFCEFEDDVMKWLKDGEEEPYTDDCPW